MRLILPTSAAALAIGMLAGGSLRAFPSVRLRWWWLALAGVVLQFLPLSGGAAFVALLASLGLLLAFVVANIGAPGSILILTGLLLNLAVIAANQGMPVTRAALVASGQEDTLVDLVQGGGAKHHLADGVTELLPLGDVIAIGRPIRQAISVGDACVHLGMAWFVVAALRPQRRPEGVELGGAVA